MSKNENFYSKQLLKVHVNKSEKSKTVIQVMQWGDNNPTLEKRNYYLKDGEWCVGKTMGINLADFKKILKHKNEIKEILAQEPEDTEDDDEDEKPSKKSKKHHKHNEEEDDD
jgi:hypothetical protein